MFNCKIMFNKYEIGEVYFNNFEDNKFEFYDNVKVVPFCLRNKKLNWIDFLNWIRGRVFPEDREDKDEILKDLSLSEYKIFDIISITHGALFTDHYWLKFSEDDSYLEYDLANRAYHRTITEEDVYQCENRRGDYFYDK